MEMQMNENRKLTGKIAIVFGGSRGIGAAAARRLASEGADVAVTYLSAPDYNGHDGRRFCSSKTNQ
jgi:NAD(P)-dependent dehydrogenase (short-subunit alcohol dehydrogenase family)